MLGCILSKVAPNSFLSQNIFPPASKFDPSKDMPDLSGQIFLVTGGNAGIGYVTIEHLLKHEAKVYLAARSASKGKEAIAKLKESTGKTAIFLELDLDDLKSVRMAAETFGRLESRLDCLILNAGVMAVPKPELTAQGYDKQFGVNTLGGYFLGTLLMPYLSASKRQNGSRARILSYTSGLMAVAPGKTGIEWGSLVGGEERDVAIKPLSELQLYGQSKLANVMLVRLFNDLNPDVTACSIHPGVLNSDLSRNMPRVQVAITRRLFYPVSYGPLTALFAATVAPEEKTRGTHFIPFARFGQPDPRVEDKETLAKLKAWLDGAVKGF